MDNRFTNIIQLIKQSRTNAIRAVNAELINLYWNIGEYISTKIEQSECFPFKFYSRQSI
jgi:hypothetical protein